MYSIFTMNELRLPPAGISVDGIWGKTGEKVEKRGNRWREERVKKRGQSR
jgi:hypothetical protein